MRAGEGFAVSEIMLMHLSLADYTRLVLAHDDVRAMAGGPREPFPGAPDTQRDVDTVPAPTAATTPVSLTPRAA